MTTAEHQHEPMADNGTNAPGKGWQRLRLVGWSLAAVILLLPAIAMLYTNEVNWAPGDFVAAAVILGGTGLLFELAIRRSRDNAYRWGVLVALATALLITWINAAVGIVGSGANPANVLYFLLPLIAFAGCWMAGFRAKGMSIALFATAAAQALVTLFAIQFNWSGGEERALMIMVINVVFIVLWSGSALLFRRAAGHGAH